MKTYKCLFGFHDYQLSASHRYRECGSDYTTFLYLCTQCDNIKQKEVSGHFIINDEKKKIESVQINKEVEKILREE